MIFNLERIAQTDKQTRGILRVFDDSERQIFETKALELPWLGNERNVSCIPEGDYECVKHDSPRFGDTFWVKDVPDRSEILIHAGNFIDTIQVDSQGCILIGRDFTFINEDEILDVTESRKTLDRLLKLSDSQVTLRVHSNVVPNVV